MNTLVRMSAESTRTRVLITQGSRDIGKAILPPASGAHPRAMATLLEGLSLFLHERLSVVLCVDERSGSYASVGLLDALGDGARSVYSQGGVAAHVTRAERRRSEQAIRLGGGGDFRDLRQLSWEWAQ